MNPEERTPVDESGRLSHDKSMIVREIVDSLEDPQLVQYCTQKREDALKELYCRYSGMIMNHLYRLFSEFGEKQRFMMFVKEPSKPGFSGWPRTLQ